MELKKIIIYIFCFFTVYYSEGDINDNHCLSCHKGIETICPQQGDMFKEIAKIAALSKKNNYCIVCHGGNPNINLKQGINKGSLEYNKLKEKAHTGTVDYFLSNYGPKKFYPDPSNPFINKETCGMCHSWKVQTQWKSLMMSQSGIIQGANLTFGKSIEMDNCSNYGNYNVKDTSRDFVLGTKQYQEYMQKLKTIAINIFTKELKSLPEVPSGGQDIHENIKKSLFTYLQGDCQRCHLGVSGTKGYGNYRGAGCSACHIPYSNDGLYHGQDISIDKTKKGAPFIHRLQGINGIPNKTCTTCHNHSMCIGTSYQGFMESPYPGPWGDKGQKQKKVYGKNYIPLQKDAHSAEGFLCQDCHTTLDVHSDGLLMKNGNCAVEIECYDCHGTVEKYPWELPLGFGDEYKESNKKGKSRGLMQKIPDYMSKNRKYKAEDGFLLSTRGNPLGNAVKKGNKIIIYLASGKTIELNPLKNKRGLSLKAKISMVQINKHIKRLECYTCHSTWAPQKYGRHIKIDYSKHQQSESWLNSKKIPGKIETIPTYLRWEYPSIAQNNEGRISPVVPGVQGSITIIDKEGNVLKQNHIFSNRNSKGFGQLAIGMKPLFPHTTQKKARNCLSCHSNSKTLGYGIVGSQLFGDPSIAHSLDLNDKTGKTLIFKVPKLYYDYSRFVSAKGRQLQSVGDNLHISKVLSKKEINHVQRQILCVSCHKELPDESIAASVLAKVGEITNMIPKNDGEHSSLMNKCLLVTAWIQVLGMIFGIIMLGCISYFTYKKKLIFKKKMLKND